MATLVARGINWNVADEEGNTALHLCESPKIMTMLLQAKADPNATNQVRSRPVLFSFSRDETLFLNIEVFNHLN